ncbi:MAG TPA: hypothetical protein VND64_22825 [Pirellulales bacterium]|nr:hypothetical protein [Pirellulales bacterium]
MRLTLRTMLAYLDEILEPADAQDVGKKIEESDFANSLMHRIRDVTRRMRLAAPRLEGRGMGLDPNTVAEYLDNTLPSERVPDFEKVCLESDVHLAEVASAHQILALVLGEPAEIEHNCRQRIYDLPNAAPQSSSPSGDTSAATVKHGAGAGSAASTDGTAARPVDGTAVPSVDGTAVPPAGGTAGPPKIVVSTSKKKKSKRRKPRSAVEVPDYLREEDDADTGGIPWRMIAVAVLLLLCIGLFANWQWPGFWQGNSGRQVAKVRSPSGDGTSDDENTGDEKQSGNAERNRAKRTEADAGGDDSSEESPENEGGKAGRGGSDAESDTTVPDDDGSEPSATDQDGAAGTDADSSEASDKTKPADEPDEPDATLVTPSVDEEMASDDDVDAPDAPRPGDKSATKNRDKTGTKETDDENNPVAKPAKKAGQVIGRMTTEHDVLLRWEGASGWKRLPTRETIHAADRLLALPTYKPIVALAVGVTLHMLGGAEVELEVPDAQGVPGVHVVRGRVVLLPVKPDCQIRLRAGGQSGLVTFGQDDAPVAVEAFQELPDGADPEDETATTRAEFYVTVGEIHWAGENGPLETIQGPARRVLEGAPAPADAEPIEAGALPAWTGTTELSLLEKNAASFLEHALAGDRPLPLVLKEVAADRKIENRLLALQSLAEIDEFEPYVQFLNDSDQIQKINKWVPQVDGMHAALARGREHATRIRKAFESQRGKSKGSELYRMLRGFDGKQLANGDDRLLVQYLSHEDLDFRVLSFWNLRRITGGAAGRTHGYLPQLSELKRKPAVAKWQKDLDSKQIVPEPGKAE